MRNPALRERMEESYRLTTRNWSRGPCGLWHSGLTCRKCEQDAKTMVNYPRRRGLPVAIDPVARFLASVGLLFERVNPVRRFFQRKTG